jgi:hypothetical protein
VCVCVCVCVCVRACVVRFVPVLACVYVGQVCGASYDGVGVNDCIVSGLSFDPPARTHALMDAF